MSFNRCLEVEFYGSWPHKNDHNGHNLVHKDIIAGEFRLMPNFTTAQVKKVPTYYNTSPVVIRYADHKVWLLETDVFEASTYEYFMIWIIAAQSWVSPGTFI